MFLYTRGTKESKKQRRKTKTEGKSEQKGWKDRQKVEARKLSWRQKWERKEWWRRRWGFAPRSWTWPSQPYCPFLSSFAALLAPVAPLHTKIFLLLPTIQRAYTSDYFLLFKSSCDEHTLAKHLRKTKTIETPWKHYAQGKKTRHKRPRICTVPLLWNI